MFSVKAAYSDDIELRAGIETVREFFLNTKNFAELMPGVLQIHLDGNGAAHWKVEAAIPFVGKMLQTFTVELTENTPERVEWASRPAAIGNFLRYSADFLEKAGGVTLVHFAEFVELRRKSARELHYMAGLAGEALISGEMTAGITTMIGTFIQRAKEKLES